MKPHKRGFTLAESAAALAIILIVSLAAFTVCAACAAALKKSEYELSAVSAADAMLQSYESAKGEADIAASFEENLRVVGLEDFTKEEREDGVYYGCGSLNVSCLLSDGAFTVEARDRSGALIVRWEREHA